MTDGTGGTMRNERRARREDERVRMSGQSEEESTVTVCVAQAE